MGKKFEIKGDDISDGYHTFTELYDHRCMLFLTLAVNQRFLGWAWRPDFEGWFCLYWQTPYGQISYHLPNRMLPFVEGRCSRNDDIKFDGHTSADVLERLSRIALSPGASPTGREG